MSLFATGSILFGQFEQHKPAWRRLLKVAIFLAVLIALAQTVGRLWAYGVLVLLGSAGGAFHFWCQNTASTVGRANLGTNISRLWDVGDLPNACFLSYQSRPVHGDKAWKAIPDYRETQPPSESGLTAVNWTGMIQK